MTDNILSNSKISEIDKDLSYKQEPLDYINALLLQYPDSYYLQSLCIYFDTDTDRIIENSEKLEKVQNTYALLGASVKYFYTNEYAKYVALIKESVQRDTFKMNRWANLKLYGIKCDENPLDAEKLYDSLIVMYPDFLDIYVAKAEFYRTTGKAEQAIELVLEYEKQYNTNNAELFCKIGECYILSGELNIAESYFNKALKLKDEPYSYNGLGWVYYFYEDYEKAKENIEKSLAIIPDEPEFCWRYAVILNLLDDPDSAFIYYRKALEYVDVNQKEEIYTNFIDCLLFNNEYEQAQEEYKKYKTEYNSVFYESKYDILFSYFLDSEFNIVKKKYNKFRYDYPDLVNDMDLELLNINVDLR